MGTEPIPNLPIAMSLLLSGNSTIENNDTYWSDVTNANAIALETELNVNRS